MDKRSYRVGLSVTVVFPYNTTMMEHLIQNNMNSEKLND